MGPLTSQGGGGGGRDCWGGADPVAATHTRHFVFVDSCSHLCFLVLGGHALARIPHDVFVL